ncbi:hypothetical protein O181_106008 [Austropuccinia psidii MF-1]|uniref:Uncharacterized protein n=1 Tax=Austropuccinia psidii MF-1 TaxID=1389203 RepID=A0A9Q3JQ18_9BASI|nr:hypothetical protein [Austropuccinia psidii MF-1]
MPSFSSIFKFFLAQRITPTKLGWTVSSNEAIRPNGELPFESLSGEMTKNQCNVIMSLVSIAENSTTKWWENYNYCEDINDGRGMTVSLVGFCSGTGDLLWVFENLKRSSPGHPLKKYVSRLEKLNGTTSTKGLHKLADDLRLYGDLDWKQAVWAGIIHFYWEPAMKFSRLIGLQYPITKGFLFDIALNHGGDQMSQMAKKVVVCTPKRGGDEKMWLSELIQVRKNIIQTIDPSTNFGQTDRCQMWNDLLESGNITLDMPIKNIMCYGDQFDIC